MFLELNIVCWLKIISFKVVITANCCIIIIIILSQHIIFVKCIFCMAIYYTDVCENPTKTSVTFIFKIAVPFVL